MTKAKTNRKTRDLAIEQTFVNLGRRLLAAQDAPKKQAALSTAVATLIQVLLQQNWRAAALYRCAEGLAMSTDNGTRSRLLEGMFDALEAGLPELASPLELHALMAGITKVLRDAKFTATEILELVDDGRGGTPEQRRGRAKSRFTAVAGEELSAFWHTALVKGNSGTPD
jgi:hypothetical protein